MLNCHIKSKHECKSNSYIVKSIIATNVYILNTTSTYYKSVQIIRFQSDSQKENEK